MILMKLAISNYFIELAERLVGAPNWLLVERTGRTDSACLAEINSE